MRARGMTNHQNLIHVFCQSGGKRVGKCPQSRLKGGWIGPARSSGIGVIMHQVIGKEFAIFGLKPAQRHDTGTHPKDDRRINPGRVIGAKPIVSPDQLNRCIKRTKAHRDHQEHDRHRNQQLHQQHPHRIECRNHRPLAQLHQTPQCTR